MVEYIAAGLTPSRKIKSAKKSYPMVRFPWKRTEAALRQLAKFGDDEIAEIDFVNPETGEDVLPTMGFTAMMFAAGQKEQPALRSSSAVFHVIKGNGQTTIDGQTIKWAPKDTFTAHVFSKITHLAKEEAFLIRVHDKPLQEKLGYYEERPR